jgi:hypothetical protein
VSGRLNAWQIENVLSPADQFDDCEGEVGEFLRVGLASADQEFFEGYGVRLMGQPVPKLRRDVRDPVPALRRAQDSA